MREDEQHTSESGKDDDNEQSDDSKEMVFVQHNSYTDDNEDDGFSDEETEYLQVMFCCLVLFRVIKGCWVRSLHGI
jgi:hypothetical protein